MIGPKEYTGIVVDDDSIRIARIEVSGKKIVLVDLDQVKLVSKLLKKAKEKEEPHAEKENIFEDLDDALTDESIFGVEEEEDEIEGVSIEELDDDFDDIDFDNLEDETETLAGVDMVDESGAPGSNELLLYNVLSAIDPKRVDVGISIPAGVTIFQILRDVDFSDTKKKDLQVIVEDRLEDLHGISKGEDYYSYTVRDDGALLLTSIDDEAGLLKLLNKTRNLYSGKLFVHKVLPDEILLLGLIRSNYELDNNTITGVIQYGENTSRVFFMKGSQLWIVSPIINEGVKSNKFLNTIFSKILFQLDTGEVPNLDKIILCNNTLGDEAVNFFSDRFQDVDISELEYSEEVFDDSGYDHSTVASFTTAIGAAWAASGLNSNDFPDVSFLPSYVKDRQKIFKLQWHGFLLLLMIFLSPIVINYFYTNNVAEINMLETEISSLDQQIQSLEPVVQEYNRISVELEQIQTTLTLLDTLIRGSLRWSTNLNIMNSGIADINSVWLTTMRSGSDNIAEIEGYAIMRNRIPLMADIFENATLTDVSTEVIRERDVFTFRYTIGKFVQDNSMYSPESTQGIQEILGGGD
ncbi:MAG: hypothetical protein FH748_01890 [Balneolaceae bacterium]|nr:hypothetical protein [Balneolaceae bacterium]